MSSWRVAWCLVAGLCVAPAVARAQTSTFYPGQGQHATLLFEDMWPGRGDYDFNDDVMRVNVERQESSPGQVTELVYNIGVYALGAQQCSGAAIDLPVPPSNVTVDRMHGTRWSSDGSPWTYEANVPVVDDGSGGSVVPIANDLRSELCGGQTGFLNTVPGDTPVGCDPLAVRIQFTTAVTNLPPEPGDVFIFRCNQPQLQVHFSQFHGLLGGPDAADPRYYNTEADASQVDANGQPTGTSFYVDSRGVPWALALGDDFYNIPAERQRIDQVMPQIVNFAETGGFAGDTGSSVSGADFWHEANSGDYTFSSSPPPLPDFDFSTFVSPQTLCTNAGGTWDGTTCTCPNSLTWTGSACVDLADPKVQACMNGSTSQWTSQSYGGGGTWTGTTCDCSALGAGYLWNGFGCYDPTQGAAQACVASGGTWTPWLATAMYPRWWAETVECDCSALGAGYAWDGTSCQPTYATTAADCTNSGGYWYDDGNGGNCRCQAAGPDWQQSGSTCVDNGARPACEAAGGTWLGSMCDCSDVLPGSVWTGQPSMTPSSGTCNGGIADACATAAGTWDGTTCTCPNSSQVFSVDTWTCMDPSPTPAGCNGTWDPATGHCACSTSGQYFDGNSCVSDSQSDACAQAGGTWYRHPTGSGYYAGSYVCDCPTGMLWDGGHCLPYDQAECELSGGAWLGTTCDCSTSRAQYSKWNGTACVWSPDVEACDIQEGGTWDATNDTCTCAAPTFSVTGTATWDETLMSCEGDPGERNCWSDGGTWMSTDLYCDCSTADNGNDDMEWDPQTEHCVYSGQAMGCAATNSVWGYGFDPNFMNQDGCDCTYGGLVYMSYGWDPDRVECIDPDGSLTCQADGLFWTGTTCDCSMSTVQDSHWDLLQRACVYSPEVAACNADPTGTGWDYNVDSCSCSPWNWDPNTQTGYCSTPEADACVAASLTWDSANQVCVCPAGQSFYYNDPDVSDGCHSAAEYACALDSIDGAYWDGTTCQCTDPKATWDGSFCTCSTGGVPPCP